MAENTVLHKAYDAIYVFLVANHLTIFEEDFNNGISFNERNVN